MIDRLRVRNDGSETRGSWIMLSRRPIPLVTRARAQTVGLSDMPAGQTHERQARIDNQGLV